MTTMLMMKIGDLYAALDEQIDESHDAQSDGLMAGLSASLFEIEKRFRHVYEPDPHGHCSYCGLWAFSNLHVHNAVA